MKFQQYQKELIEFIINNHASYHIEPMILGFPLTGPFTIVRRYDRGKVQPGGTPLTDRTSQSQA